MSEDTKWGWVYFIGQDWGEVKIGFSVNPKERIKQIQINTEKELKILLAVPGTIQTERDFHEYFDDVRIRGEWFDLHFIDTDEQSEYEESVLLRGLSIAYSVSSDWMNLDPFKSQNVKKKNKLDKHKKILGKENFHLCETLFSLSSVSSKQFEEFIARLVHNTRGVNPSSECMGYGIMAAIQQSKLSASYVIGAAVKGFNEGRCSNE